MSNLQPWEKARDISAQLRNRFEKLQHETEPEVEPGVEMATKEKQAIQMERDIIFQDQAAGIFNLKMAEKRFTDLKQFISNILWHVDVNRLSWLEVFSHGSKAKRNEHTVQMQADAKSGALIVQGLNRKNDLTPASQRMFISDILWQGYKRLAVLQNEPSNKLRLVWFDTVINEPTKSIA
ncbi:hypothetical protein F4777DRAFT_579899 [Nemania sp. FL0916]|nr:hypothetical protein F4777DRAFT_579899 [Nemania sp. FL0916]